MPRNSSSARRILLAPLVLALGCAHLRPAEEIALGDEYHARLSWQAPMIRDPVVLDYVSEVGGRIARAAGPQPVPLRFHVLVDDSCNAFAAPGGHVYLHTGTLLRVRDVSELAGVLAHEVGHVVHRHVVHNYERATNAGRARQMGALAAGLVAGLPAAAGVNALGTLASVAVLNSFTRDDERDADDFAVEILPAAGYDPEGLVRFFRMLLPEGEGGAPALLRSHPDTRERMEEAEQSLRDAPPPPGLRRRDGGRLEIIQRRVRLLLGEAPPGP
jgi:predicted Zn-dependent protease